MHPEANSVIPYFSKEHIDPETPYPAIDNLINRMCAMIDAAHANHSDDQQAQK